MDFERLLDVLLLLTTGGVLGVVGSTLGVGGGFLLVPFLLFFFPELEPAQVTTISLVVVFFNSSFGSLLMILKKRVPSLSLVLGLALLAAPGAWLGARATAHVSRDLFLPLFALSLLGLAFFLLWRNLLVREAPESQDPEGALRPLKPSVGLLTVGIGFIASFFGVGGGLIHVPVLIYLQKLWVSAAVGTSLSVLALTSLVAALEHLSQGRLAGAEWVVLSLAPSLIAGSYAGIQLQGSLPPRVSLLLLAGLLLAVAMSLLL